MTRAHTGENMETSNPLFQNLLEAARRGGDDDWVLIDARLPEVRSAETIDWAFGPGLSDNDDNIRDFAASLIEDWVGELPEGAEARIVELMNTDSHLPVRLRLAAGRWKRGDRSDLVRGILNEAAATDNPTMSGLANRLLKDG